MTTTGLKELNKTEMDVRDEKLSTKPLAMWSPQESTCPEYDSDSNPFEDDRSMTKIKPEVELKEETEGFVYKADISGHLKLVCPETDLPHGSSELIEPCATPSNYNSVSIEFKSKFITDDVRSEPEHLKNQVDDEMVEETPTEDARYTSNFSLLGPHTLMAFPSDQKYIDVFQVPQNEYSESTHQKLFPVDENFHKRCGTDLSENCENKISYHIELSNTFLGGKQTSSQVRNNNENSWMYNMQAMRLSDDVINTSDLPYTKDSYDDLDDGKRISSDSEADLWQLYQELLMQKKMEGKLVQTEEQKREKMKEIGRIRARLYRAKLKQNGEMWEKHKAMRAQKQREERLKMSEEQRERIKALARIRAKKHREKLKVNEETWKKYKEMRAEKQRLERIKAKEQIKEEVQQLELMRLAEQSEKAKELARERAKKHREHLKRDADTWHLYKEARAQRKREERLTMTNDQRERLKELARIRAKKYREKLKENAIEWQRYKEMRARKQREERLKLTEDQKLKAKELARERAKLYREKKKMKEQVMTDPKTSDAISRIPNWYENSNIESNNNCSVYFYHSFKM